MENKILLKENKHVSESKLRDAKKQKERFESIIGSVEAFFDKKLTHKEKKDLFELKGEFLQNEFMKTAQFPQSTLDFNLDAVGKKGHYYALLSQVNKLYKHQYINLIRGKLVIDEEAIKETGRKYIETELQQEAYDIAVKLLPLVNRLDELRILREAYVRDALKVIRLDGNNMPTINLDYINSLKRFR